MDMSPFLGWFEPTKWRPSKVGCTKRLREESGDGAARDVESPTMVPL